MSVRNSAKSLHPSLKSERLSLQRTVSLTRYRPPDKAMPAALGTQVVGSILRPASFCGCIGFKPSVGGINRGGSYDYFSQSCTGVLAASLVCRLKNRVTEFGADGILACRLGDLVMARQKIE